MILWRKRFGARNICPILFGLLPGNGTNFLPLKSNFMSSAYFNITEPVFTISLPISSIANVNEDAYYAVDARNKTTLGKQWER